MRTKTLNLRSAGMLPLLLAIPLLFGGPEVAAKDKNKSQDPAALAAELPRLQGPKRTVAISNFGATSIFDNLYGLSDVGGGLSALLTTALVESEQFIVVERGVLSSVLSEQELAAAGMLENDGQPAVGELLGAQFMLQGEVTEFGERAKGGGFSIGFGSGDKRLGLAPRKSIGVVGIDVRVINTSTGQILNSFSVREEVKAKAIALVLEKDDISLGHDTFAQTPLGQAARAAINEVVRQFAETAASEPWRGAVVEYDRYGVAINAGSDSGVRAGDTFQVQRVTKVLTDPVTGRVLGKRAHQVGQVRIVQVEDSIAFGDFLPLADTAPRRGDMVTTL